MTRSRIQAIHDKVNSLLNTLDLDTTLDGLLLHASTLCVLSYEPQEPPSMDKSPEGTEDQAKEDIGEEEQMFRLQSRRTGPHAGTIRFPPDDPVPNRNTLQNTFSVCHQTSRRATGPSGVDPGEPDLAPNHPA